MIYSKLGQKWMDWLMEGLWCAKQVKDSLLTNRDTSQGTVIRTAPMDTDQPWIAVRTGRDPLLDMLSADEWRQMEQNARETTK